jgi:hypothetical protein
MSSQSVTNGISSTMSRWKDKDPEILDFILDSEDVRNLHVDFEVVESLMIDLVTRRRLLHLMASL